MMKPLHQLMPIHQHHHQQQQQQLWQYHVSQYQPRQQDATPPPPPAWHNMPSLRPTMAMVPPPAMPTTQLMELFCAPYQAAAAAQVDIELVSARRTTNLYCSLYRTVMLLMLKSTKKKRKKKKRKGIHATTVFNLATPEKDSAAGDELRGLSCN
jgi:hypothetical protein